MDSGKEQEIEARLSKIESTLVALQRSVEGLIGERPRVTGGPDIGAKISEWFSSRAPEWWLSRLGIGFVVIAVLFLYSYAVEQGWIVPLVRVVFGALVGTGLFWAATRTSSDDKSDTYGIGMRQLLYGGALATWYVTAYAAAVWYGLISIAAARLLFFVLAIVSTWIALAERREIFAFIAVATGFATPFILPAPIISLTPFALYLGAVAAIGLFIYLIRGWPSTIWITFLAFWLILNGTVFGNTRASAQGSIAIAVLVIIAGVAFTRVASLRRQLLALGSKRYTQEPPNEATRRVMELQDGLSTALGGGKSHADSLALWVMTLLSPILAVSILAGMWPNAPQQISGLVLIGLGSAALYFGMSRIPDRELRQVVFTGAALWTLLGILKAAPDPEALGLASIFAALVLAYIRNALIGPRTIAKVAIVVALTVVIGRELSFYQDGLVRWRWFISELVTLAASVIIIRKLLADPREKMQGVVLGVLTYVTSLALILHVFESIWPPLVTATYAVFGAVLLVLSKKRGSERVLRQLGAVTMLIVVARLFLVDMASVEAVWRVLLFLGIGGVFLYAGYKLQLSRVTDSGK